MGSFAMAVQNLKYRKFRSGVLCFFVFLLSACLFITTLLLYSMNKQVEQGVQRMGADLIVAPGEYSQELRDAMFLGTPCTITLDRVWLDNIRTVAGVEKASPQLYIATMQESPCCDAPSQLIAFDPETDFIVHPWLDQYNISSLALGEVIIGSNFLVEVGDTIKFYDMPFTVAAKMEETGLSYDTSIFLSFDTMAQMADTPAAQSFLRLEDYDRLISMILVDVASGTEIEQVKRDIDFTYYKQGIEVTTANSLVSNAAQEAKQYTVYSVILMGLLFFVIVIAMVLIFTITIHERKREIGILYAMGGKKGQIMSMICLEALLISGFGGALGIAVSWAGMGLFHSLISMKLGLSALNTGFGIGSVTGLLCMALALLTGLIGAAYSMVSIARQEPYLLTRENE